MKIRSSTGIISAVALYMACAGAQTVPLPYNPVTAEYSSALDRIIFISANPNQLHIFDPITDTDTPVNLPKAPLSLSVSLDGLHAAVGHDALISLVDLQTGSLDKTLPVNQTVNGLVLGSDYVYVLGGGGSIQISTGATSSASGIFAGSYARLHPTGTAIYSTSSGSPGLLDDLNVSTGPITSENTGPYWGDYAVCGGVWFSPDGHRVYTGCGTAYQAAPQDTVQGMVCCSSQGLLDSGRDGLYWATLAHTSMIRSLAESATLGRVATIPFSNQYTTPQVNDNQVFWYDSAFLEPAGTFQLPDFLVGSTNYHAHGQQVFFNQASTALYVVMQADSSSNLLNSFAVQVYAIGNPPSCSPGFSSSGATVAASGTVMQVGITAPATCIYQAASNDVWIQLVSGAYGSGNGTLSYIVRPNSGSERSGSITVGGQTFTVTQSAASAPTSLAQLGYSVVGAGYSKTLDRAVLVTTNPNELHIYDPISLSDRIVSLPKPPFFVSVGPDGLSAAVGMDGWVSVINLSTASVTSTMQMFSDVHTLVLAGNGYFYAYPQRTWGNLISAEIATKTLYSIGSIYNGRYPQLYIDGTEYYTEDSKWDISAGPAKIIDQNFSGNSCAPFWLTEDGNRLIDSCGKAYTTSPVPSQDLQYNGSFSNAPTIQWADESAKLHSTAVIPSVVGYNGTPNADTYLQMYGDAFLGYVGALSLPEFTVASSPYAGHGRYVFFNSTEDTLIVLEQADSSANLTADYGAAVFPLNTPAAGCSYSLGASSASVSNFGGLNTVNVATGTACIWESASSASWITIDSGAAGFGANAVTYAVAPNTASGGRSGTLTIAGHTFTVTQAGTAGARTATHLSVTAAGAATAGVPIQITVQALDGSNNVVSAYSDPVHFTSSDGSAMLPSDSILDGSGTFSASLATLGAQTITVTDSFTSSITGTSGNITVSPAMGLQFVPITPCRAVDTRNPAGPLAGPSIAGGTSRSFAIAGNACGIPSGAQAYSLNAAIVPTAHGYMTLWPTGQAQPTTASVNSPDGGVHSNGAVVPAGTGGAISAYAFDTMDVVLDINGYFVPTADNNPSALAFYPLTPCRVVDTRNGTGDLGGPFLSGGSTRTFPVAEAIGCNISSTAQAYSLNLAVVPHGAFHYLTAWPDGQSQPPVASLNDPQSINHSNGAIVPAGAHGSIDLYATNDTDVVIDINGYFAPPGTGGLSFYALPPCRSLDTRNPAGAPPFSATLAVNVAASGCGGTPTAQAYVFNATALPQNSHGYLTLWQQNAAQPSAVNLNDPNGTTTGNMAIVPTSNGSIEAYFSGSTYLVLDLLGYFAP